MERWCYKAQHIFVSWSSVFISLTEYIMNWPGYFIGMFHLHSFALALTAYQHIDSPTGRSFDLSVLFMLLKFFLEIIFRKKMPKLKWKQLKIKNKQTNTLSNTGFHPTLFSNIIQAWPNHYPEVLALPQTASTDPGKSFLRQHLLSSFPRQA